MSGYTKLFSDIVDSSIWQESAETCKVWVTLLALSDADGFVRGSVGWLANKARVPLETCESALKKLESPDPHSRTPDYEGRRIERLPDGFLILNYLLFRNRLSSDPKASSTRERVRKHRERFLTQEALRNDSSVTARYVTHNVLRNASSVTSPVSASVYGSESVSGSGGIVKGGAETGKPQAPATVSPTGKPLQGVTRRYKALQGVTLLRANKCEQARTNANASVYVYGSDSVTQGGMGGDESGKNGDVPAPAGVPVLDASGTHSTLEDWEAALKGAFPKHPLVLSPEVMENIITLLNRGVTLELFRRVCEWRAKTTNDYAHNSPMSFTTPKNFETAIGQMEKEKNANKSDNNRNDRNAGTLNANVDYSKAGIHVRGHVAP